VAVMTGSHYFLYVRACSFVLVGQKNNGDIYSPMKADNSVK